MKRLVHFCLLSLVFLSGLSAPAALAQSCADNAPTARDVTAFFADPVLSDDPATGARVFTIDLALNPAVTFDLGGVSLFFTYDDDALDFRRVVYSEFASQNACYGTLDNNNDATDGGQTAIGLIINPFACNPANGTAGSRLTAGGPPVVLATVAYTVVDPSAEASFAFTNTVSNDDLGQSCVTRGDPFFPQQLPVELVSFSAIADGTSALLRWTTASETNNAGFAVEHRRAPGTGEPVAAAAWREVGVVPGGGTTQEQRAYSFQVEGLSAGVHRFRLRQLDLDGAVTYSGEQELHIAPASTAQLNLWPNPARGTAHVAFVLPQAGKARVVLYDLLGREVARPVDGELAAGPHSIRLDTRALPSGMYLCRLSTATGSSDQMLTVVAR